MMEERRRAPRHEIGDTLSHVPSREGVRVIDISTAGVLLQSGQTVQPGSLGTLRFTLAGAAFSAQVKIRRVTQPAQAGGGYRIGASFVDMSPEDRQVIERFMSHD